MSNDGDFDGKLTNPSLVQISEYKQMIWGIKEPKLLLSAYTKLRCCGRGVRTKGLFLERKNYIW